MLTPKQTLDQNYLEARRDLLEVAALLDRYDEAVKRSADESVSDPRLDALRSAMTTLAQKDHPEANRTSQLLEQFSQVN